MAYERLHWVETETPLSADNMNNIEDGIEELQAQKVDKVTGKGLSTEDYTTEEKTKVAEFDSIVERVEGNTIGAAVTVPRTVGGNGKSATFNYTFSSDGYFEIYNNSSGQLPAMGWDLVIGNMPIDITFKYEYTKTVNAEGSAATFQTVTGHGRQVYFVREGMVLSGGFVIGPPLLAESIVTKFYPISY